MTASGPRGVGGLLEHVAALEDPGVERAQRHPLVSVVTRARWGGRCGAGGWGAIAPFGQEWFAPFLDLPNGIPSDDTFGRVFAELDAAQFAACRLDAGGGRGAADPGDRVGRPDRAPRARPQRGHSGLASGECLGTGWCSPRWRWTPSRMQSPPCRCCSVSWPWRAPWGPSIPWPPPPHSLPTPSRPPLTTPPPP